MRKTCFLKTNLIILTVKAIRGDISSIYMYYISTYNKSDKHGRPQQYRRGAGGGGGEGKPKTNPLPHKDKKGPPHGEQAP